MLLFCLDLPDFFLEERDSASESAQAVAGFPERFIRGGTGLSRDFLPAVSYTHLTLPTILRV